MTGFENVGNHEMQQLLDAPVLIAILIGGADGHLDREELRWADKLIASRSYSGAIFLREYYEAAGNKFYKRMKTMMAGLPQDATERNEQLSTQLAQLNSIIAKLDATLAGHLYKSYRALAEEAARASGGFLRIGAVSAAEHRWVRLEMITPLEAPPLPQEMDTWEEEKDDE